MIISPKKRSEQLKLVNLDAYDDHYSLMSHFQREVCKGWRKCEIRSSGWCNTDEFFDMLNEYLVVKRKLWDKKRKP